MRVSASYEWSRSRERIVGRFGGERVPVPWDAPHRFRVSLDASPVAFLTVTARAEAIVGRTWGFRQAYYDLLEPLALNVSGEFDFATPGAHRLPAFVQVDLNAAYSRRLVRGVGLQVRAGVINALARDNVRDWTLGGEAGNLRIVPRLGMPLVPEASLRLTW